jgi:hypothetical protein
VSASSIFCTTSCCWVCSCWSLSCWSAARAASSSWCLSSLQPRACAPAHQSVSGALGTHNGDLSVDQVQQQSPWPAPPSCGPAGPGARSSAAEAPTRAPQPFEPPPWRARPPPSGAPACRQLHCQRLCVPLDSMWCSYATCVSFQISIWIIAGPQRMTPNPVASPWLVG